MAFAAEKAIVFCVFDINMIGALLYIMRVIDFDCHEKQLPQSVSAYPDAFASAVRDLEAGVASGAVLPNEKIHLMLHGRERCTGMLGLKELISMCHG